MPAHRYEFELSALHEMLTLTVSNLLTDSQAIVKQTLIESGITKLCVFFGRQKGSYCGDPLHRRPITKCLNFCFQPMT